MLTKLRKLFEKKPTPREQALIDDYEAGRFLHVDKDVDNKKLFKKK